MNTMREIVISRLIAKEASSRINFTQENVDLLRAAFEKRTDEDLLQEVLSDEYFESHKSTLPATLEHKMEYPDFPRKMIEEYDDVTHMFTSGPTVKEAISLLKDIAINCGEYATLDIQTNFCYHSDDPCTEIHVCFSRLENDAEYERRYKRSMKAREAAFKRKAKQAEKQAEQVAAELELYRKLREKFGDVK